MTTSDREQELLDKIKRLDTALKRIQYASHGLDWTAITVEDLQYMAEQARARERE